MADKTISDLTQAESIGSEDLFVLQQNGEAKKLPGSILKKYIANIDLNDIEDVSFDAQDRCVIKLSDGTTITSAPLKGKDGYTPTASVTKDGKTVTITITDDTGTTSETVSDGTDAPTITNIAIDENYHLIITMSNGTSYDAGYCRGASGAGTGDMIASIYDPQGKAQDVYAYTDNAVNDAKPKSVIVTLTASGWVDGVQTVTISGVLADENDQLIQPVPALASQAAYIEAGILCTGQAADSLTFTATTAPTDDLTVYVVITEVTAG